MSKETLHPSTTAGGETPSTNGDANLRSLRTKDAAKTISRAISGLARHLPEVLDLGTRCRQLGQNHDLREF